MSESPEDRVRVEVKGLMLDPNSNVPIVILREAGGSEILPIWIGVFEANAIALSLEKIEPTRPMTHDLIANLVEQMEIDVCRVVICDLQESTFFARIDLQRGSRPEVSIDSRPSDAIALALRVDALIFVTRGVLDQARDVDLSDQLGERNKIRKWLEEVDPEDLGKYTM